MARMSTFEAAIVGGELKPTTLFSIITKFKTYENSLFNPPYCNPPKVLLNVAKTTSNNHQRTSNKSFVCYLMLSWQRLATLSVDCSVADEKVNSHGF